MKKIFLLIGFTAFFGRQSFSQDSTSVNEKYFWEKNIFSGIFDFDIDTMFNTVLYSKVADWIHTKYHYGGNTEKGIDCSGFSKMLYEWVYNIKLIGGSADIYKTVSPVEKQDLKEGDLVFFKIRKNVISHVGVYLANNKFVHATVKSGVIISDLDEEYYKKRYYKGGRVKKE